MNQKRTEIKTNLNEAGVDLLSEAFSDFLNDKGLDRLLAVRLRLLVDDSLYIWHKALGSDTVATVRIYRRLFHDYINIEASGPPIDPFDDKEEFGLGNGSATRKILADLSVAPSYIYNNGVNKIEYSVHKKKIISSSAIMLLSIILGILVGVVSNLLPESVQNFMYGDLLYPLYSTFLGLISAIAGFMMFFMILYAICGIGDKATLGNMGKKLVGGYVMTTFLVVASCTIAFGLIVGLSLNASVVSGGDVFLNIFQMILDIVPNNFVTAFSEGNTLQMVFIAVLLGVGLLIMGDRSLAVTVLVDQINSLIQTVMDIVGGLISVFIFISMILIFLGDTFSSLTGCIGMLVAYVVGAFLIMFIMMMLAAVKTKIPVLLLFKKTLPSLSIALTTASSATAFPTSVQACTGSLGIDEKLVNFALPLGTALYKIGVAYTYVTIAIFFADISNVPITISYLLITILLCTILSIATPPVAGGAASCYAILILQLGLPNEMTALAITLNVLMDFVLTMLNVGGNQLTILIAAKNWNMVDLDILSASKS